MYKEKYSKWEIYFDTGALFVTENGFPYHSYQVSFSRKFGLMYNFYQKKNTNLSIGICKNDFDSREVEKYNRPYFGSIYTESGPFTYVEIPFEFQKIYKLNPLHSYFFFSIGSNFIFDINNSDLSETTGRDNENTFFYSVNEKAPFFNVGLNLGTGVLIPTKILLLKIQMKINHNFKPYLYLYEDYTLNHYQTKDFQKLGQNQVSFGISITPKKRLFKK